MRQKSFHSCWGHNDDPGGALGAESVAPCLGWSKGPGLWPKCWCSAPRPLLFPLLGEPGREKQLQWLVHAAEAQIRKISVCKTIQSLLVRVCKMLQPYFHQQRVQRVHLLMWKMDFPNLICIDFSIKHSKLPFTTMPRRQH